MWITNRQCQLSDMIKGCRKQRLLLQKTYLQTRKNEVAPSQARANRWIFLSSPTIRHLSRCLFRDIQFATLTALAGNGGKWCYRRFSWTHTRKSTHDTRKARHGLLRAFYGRSAMQSCQTSCCSAVPDLWFSSLTTSDYPSTGHSDWGPLGKRKLSYAKRIFCTDGYRLNVTCESWSEMC